MKTVSIIIFLTMLLVLGLSFSRKVIRVALEPSGREERAAEIRERMKEAVQAAEAVENLALRAFVLSRIAVGLSRINPTEASQVIDRALEAAHRIDSPFYRDQAVDLKKRAESWEEEEQEKISPFLDRVENTGAKAWLWRVIAADAMLIDQIRAENFFQKALEKAEAIKNPRHRDLDLRAIASEMAKLNREKALWVAGNIQDTKIKVWALRTIASETTQEDPAWAFEVWKRAVAVTGEIHGAVARVQTLCKIALELSALDQKMSASLFNQAIQTAVEIEKPYMKAYILSDIACALALVDTEEAAGVAAKINKRHADARFSAWMQIASRTSAQDNLEKAAAIAEEIKERYDRAKALGRIASAMTPLNPERALELAEKIEYPYIRDEALSLLAKEWPKNRKKEVPDFIGNIHNPFLQGKAYKETALRINQKNPKKAEKLLMKATSLAEEIKSGPLLWDIATTWAKINPDKLYDLLARTEGHEVYRSRGLTEIALKEWGSDRIRSEMVLEMAVKTAERVDDAYHRSDLLREISMEWTKIDRVKAETVFRKAVEAAEKIEIAVPFIGS